MKENQTDIGGNVKVEFDGFGFHLRYPNGKLFISQEMLDKLNGFALVMRSKMKRRMTDV